ncbi:PadR family transcriptional regulator [Clostridium cellulovorans]|uniref:Transcriptional regulator PadR family protein n=1 Tax=Clostridium cellulovorans (strain ATCC 35296 / DSM 3052 / OCM 3 / 743B) TaxID=573061 RepID=D9SNA2_CLOC7|nr:PadR family transcriptional regulator [Clostridium cellulovorans]ADL53894.1 transcriptional regulator PadR family protein [Clostridium cellulovorans 743B]
MKKTANEFLPLTETTYLILTSLWQPLHGYGIMQNVERITNSRIILAPGTLYGALSKLTKDKLIEVVDTSLEVDRKKTYELTALGRTVVQLELNRLETLLVESKKLLGGVNFGKD